MVYICSFEKIIKSAQEKEGRKNDNLDERVRGRNKGKGKIDFILSLEYRISLGSVRMITHQNLNT